MRKINNLFFFFVIILSLSIIGCSMAISGIEAEMPDLNNKQDGIYRGNYNMSSTPNKATVEVFIHDHQIIKIDILEHSCSSIGKKAEKIIESIIAYQSLSVDVISGATSSSKTILKAVENALQ